MTHLRYGYQRMTHLRYGCQRMTHLRYGYQRMTHLRYGCQRMTHLRYGYQRMTHLRILITSDYPFGIFKLFLLFLCCVLYFFVLCLVYPMLPVYLDCPFMVAPSVFSNVY